MRKTARYNAIANRKKSYSDEFFLFSSSTRVRFPSIVLELFERANFSNAIDREWDEIPSCKFTETRQSEQRLIIKQAINLLVQYKYPEKYIEDAAILLSRLASKAMWPTYISARCRVQMKKEPRIYIYLHSIVRAELEALPRRLFVYTLALAQPNSKFTPAGLYICTTARESRIVPCLNEKASFDAIYICYTFSIGDPDVAQI